MTNKTALNAETKSPVDGANFLIVMLVLTNKSEQDLKAIVFLISVSVIVIFAESVIKP